jgi:hypothetical protein
VTAWNKNNVKEVQEVVHVCHDDKLDTTAKGSCTFGS